MLRTNNRWLKRSLLALAMVAVGAAMTLGGASEALARHGCYYGGGGWGGHYPHHGGGWGHYGHGPRAVVVAPAYGYGGYGYGAYGVGYPGHYYGGRGVSIGFGF